MVTYIDKTTVPTYKSF